MRDKKRSHANRRKKRRSQQLAKPGQSQATEVRPSIMRKYIQPAVGIPTQLSTETLPAASGAFVANRGGGGKKLYRLEDVVGEKAKVPLKLVKWDAK